MLVMNNSKIFNVYLSELTKLFVHEIHVSLTWYYALCSVHNVYKVVQARKGSMLLALAMVCLFYREHYLSCGSYLYESDLSVTSFTHLWCLWQGF